MRRDPAVAPSDGVVPFTPSGPEFFRHMILLTKLIPGNAYNFPNSSLSTAEQVLYCARKDATHPWTLRLTPLGLALGPQL